MKKPIFLSIFLLTIMFFVVLSTASYADRICCDYRVDGGSWVRVNCGENSCSYSWSCSPGSTYYGRAVNDNTGEVVDAGSYTCPCNNCECCLGGYPDCPSACRAAFGPGQTGSCVNPTSTDPSNCCECHLVCTPHASYSCYDRDVYWYNSCGNREEKKQECGGHYWANEYRCSGNWQQRKHVYQGCSGNSCYSNSVWENWWNCGSSYWADEYRCSGNWRQRKHVYQGCSGESCYSNSVWENWWNCGSSYWTNEYRCSGNTRQRKYVNRECSGSGTSCSSWDEWKNVQDCGSSYWTNEYRCSGNTRQRKYVNQGCSGSSCYSRDEWRNVQDCGGDYCESWGSNYCKDNDVYHKRTCHNRGCSGSSCYDNTYTQEEKVQECGGSYCESWSSNYCKDNDVYHKRTCHNRGCSGNSCYDNTYTDEVKVQECGANGCSGGACIACECTSGACCDGCSYRPSSYQCRGSAGVCDVAEYCSGSSASCPSNSFRPSSYVCDSHYQDDYGCPWGSGCGADVGVRSNQRYCSGSSASCNGAVSGWGSWSVQDACSSEETCADNDPTCNYDSACVCSCSWTNDVCGGGTCPSNQMRQTGSCSPAGCAAEERCVDDTCSGWVKNGCCGIGSANQERTCTLGCGTEQRCIADATCICMPGQKSDCPKQKGVCAGSQQVCSGFSWPGCSDADYLAYNPNYENPEVNLNDGLDNDCDGLVDEDPRQEECQAQGKHFRYKQCATGVCEDDNSDWVCCDYEDDCVYEGVCYRDADRIVAMHGLAREEIKNSKHHNLVYHNVNTELSGEEYCDPGEWQSESSSITGTVSNLKGDTTIEDVRVTALGGPEVYTDYTDDSGVYSMIVTGDVTYDVSASKTDYITQTKSVYVADGATETQNFNLRFNSKCDYDCTYFDDNLCHADCNNDPNGCRFYNEIAIEKCATPPNQKQPGFIVQYSSDEDIVCCDGEPYVPVPYKAVTKVNTTGNIVTIRKPVWYGGKLVNMVITFFD